MMESVDQEVKLPDVELCRNWTEIIQAFDSFPPQVNIHDLALFPDMEGLAGFIKQKIRLHWLAGR
jgi:hypothetical protein